MTPTPAPGAGAPPHEPPPTSEEVEMIEGVEADPAACGLSLEAWAEWLRSVLPGRVHGHHQGPLPLRPTRALPGSEEKIRELTRRASRGETLFHPDDARGPSRQRRGPEEPADG